MTLDMKIFYPFYIEIYSLIYNLPWPVSCKSSINNFVQSFLTFKTCINIFLLQNLRMVDIFYHFGDNLQCLCQTHLREPLLLLCKQSPQDYFHWLIIGCQSARDLEVLSSGILGIFRALLFSSLESFWY